MSKVSNRKIQVLKIIVEKYLETGGIMGSKSLLENFDLGVSSATIRNDMAALEKMGLIFQPYNSAWRLPTDQGIRIFVDYLMENQNTIFIDEGKEIFNSPRKWNIDDIVYSLVERLTVATREVTFACIPSEWILSYLWISHLIKDISKKNTSDIETIVQLLESKKVFIDMLTGMNITSKVGVFIGEDNNSLGLKNISLIIKKAEIHGKESYIGIIGSIKMDYAFNIATLRQIL